MGRDPGGHVGVRFLRWHRILLGAVAAITTAGAAVLPLSAYASPLEPLRIAVFGDSIIWGQGLPDDQKMWNLYAQDLQLATGRSVEVSNYSHSGAPLGYQHPGTDAAVFPGDCADGSAAPGEVPDPTTAVIDCQIPQAAASGQAFDLVLLNGCINDLGVFPPMVPDYRTATNLTLGSAPVEDAVHRYCVPELAGALHQAHALPGSPKVALLGYYPFVSQQSVIAPVAGAATARSQEFSQVFDQVGSDAARQAGGWATYVPSGLTDANALQASAPQVFNGTDDPLFGQRTQQCAPYSDRFYGLCPVASLGHPNADGDQSYRRALDNSTALHTWAKQWSVSSP